ncbi:MAG: FHA domain-containing protein [Desulfarculaceae bacterium]|nr:FHA domain-containing protein [Desulfarculaceae bacterium]
MIRLLLVFEGEVQKELTLSKGQGVNIGRKSTNEIVIDNATVSGKHAEVQCLEKGILLTDLDSKNGTFVNRTRIHDAYWLQKGDVVAIGKHQIVVPKDQKDRSEPVELDSDTDKTIILDTRNYNSAAKKKAAEQSESVGARDAMEGILYFIAGGNGEVRLDRNIVQIGKDGGNDIEVKGWAVGATAFTIARRPDGYYLNYIKSLAKPRVNNKKVKSSVKLNNFDRIKLGGTVLEFHCKASHPYSIGKSG